MPPDELLEEFEIDLAPIWPAQDGRLEPIFLVGSLGLGFEEFEELDPLLAPGVPEVPLLVEFEEFLKLDPERSDAGPDEPPPTPRQRASAPGLFGSLGVHLLPLLVLINWSSAPTDTPETFPVQFVIEESLSAPDEAPPGRPVAETISETPSKADGIAADTAAPPPVRPAPTKTAAVMPRPPTPTPPPAVTLSTPAPPSPVVHSLNPAPREARMPGPDPARSDYFDHLVALTRGHLDLLPLAFLAGRRGQTTLSVVVQGDGTIGRIAVKRSSGYPDIDAKIEQIVAAVGRFPPPPESFERPSVELDFNLAFPNALRH